MDLVRFGIGLGALVVLAVIWGPVLARGLYPYSDKFSELQKRQTEEAEAKTLIQTPYWIVFFANLLALTTPAYNARLLLIADAIAIPLVVCWHFIIRNHRNKKRNPSIL